MEERRNALFTMLSRKNTNIKASDLPLLEAMQRLVDDLDRVGNPSICPHGQPILFKIMGEDLQKRIEFECGLK